MTEERSPGLRQGPFAFPSFSAQWLHERAHGIEFRVSYSGGAAPDFNRLPSAPPSNATLDSYREPGGEASRGLDRCVHAAYLTRSRMAHLLDHGGRVMLRS